MKRRGRPVLGVIAGLFFGLSIGLVLLVFGVLALDSTVLVILPIAGVVVGLVLALVAPLGGRSASPPAPQPPPR
jgi:multisubunit Na+/H+ antiporter MnhB subunit